MLIRDVSNLDYSFLSTAWVRAPKTKPTSLPLPEISLFLLSIAGLYCNTYLPRLDKFQNSLSLPSSSTLRVDLR
jgi:hypothetical protein